MLQRKPVIGCDKESKPQIHRFQHGQRVCQCGAIVVPEPHTTNKGNFGRNVARKKQQ